MPRLPVLDRLVGSRDQGQSVWVEGATRPVPVRSTIVSELQTVHVAGSDYSAADAIGGGIAFERLVPGDGGSCIIETVTVIDQADQGANLDIFLFDDQITFTADNAAFDPSDADMLKCIGVITVDTWNAADKSTIGTEKSVGLAVQVAPGKQALWAQLVTRGTPTYVADQLHVRLTAIQA